MAYILFADDVPAAVEFAAAALSAQGHRTAVVKNGLEALRVLRTEVPDVLVTDIMMPFADGFQVIQEVRASDLGKHVAIVVLTTIMEEMQPGRDWSMPIESYVLRHEDTVSFGWQIVLAVEQLLQHPE